MFENANRETILIWTYINSDREINQEISEIVIRALKKQRKPQRVCFAVALDLRALMRKKCGFGNLCGDLAQFSLLQVDWQLLSRAIMHEVIFGETNNV
jgi:hypothetical protein